MNNLRIYWYNIFWRAVIHCNQILLFDTYANEKRSTLAYTNNRDYHKYNISNKQVYVEREYT
jgi:hypothetical protein